MCAILQLVSALKLTAENRLSIYYHVFIVSHYHFAISVIQFKLGPRQQNLSIKLWNF